jgi:hypothetical protein
VCFEVSLSRDNPRDPYMECVNVSGSQVALLWKPQRTCPDNDNLEASFVIGVTHGVISELLGR